LVTQIGDGENGGVMMNEFPSAFKKAWHEAASGGKSGIVGLTGTEYLELIQAAGCQPSDYPTCQAVGQHQIWQQVAPDNCKPQTVANAIASLQQTNPNFHIDGASWTNHISWVKGYENVLNPMNQFSALFHQKIDPLLPTQSELSGDLGSNSLVNSITKQSQYRLALTYNLLLQTSCFRYWGQGMWTDYAQQIYQRGEHLLHTNF
jgi:hypothetical protein